MKIEPYKIFIFSSNVFVTKSQIKVHYKHFTLWVPHETQMV